LQKVPFVIQETKTSKLPAQTEETIFAAVVQNKSTTFPKCFFFLIILVCALTISLFTGFAGGLEKFFPVTSLETLLSTFFAVADTREVERPDSVNV